MKTKLITLLSSALLALGLLAVVPAVKAEPAGGPPDGQKKERRAGGFEERLAKMREMLDLSEDQVTKLKPILKAEFEELAAKRKELGKDASQEDRQAAMKTIHEKYRSQIEAILTPEQIEKLKSMKPGKGKNGKGKDAPPAS
jgi:Spy/CpxP family protein refolding chaperone